jgi:hypothetical protein
MANKYITERPPFDDIASIRDDIIQVYQTLCTFADSDNSDISTEAGELLIAVTELHRSTIELLLVKEDDDNTN